MNNAQHLTFDNELKILLNLQCVGKKFSNRMGKFSIVFDGQMLNHAE